MNEYESDTKNELPLHHSKPGQQKDFQHRLDLINLFLLSLVMSVVGSK